MAFDRAGSEAPGGRVGDDPPLGRSRSPAAPDTPLGKTALPRRRLGRLDPQPVIRSRELGILFDHLHQRNGDAQRIVDDIGWLREQREVALRDDGKYPTGRELADLLRLEALIDTCWQELEDFCT